MFKYVWMIIIGVMLILPIIDDIKYRNWEEVIEYIKGILAIVIFLVILVVFFTSLFMFFK